MAVSCSASTTPTSSVLSEACTDAILYDLHWLGVFPDATEYQSRRFPLYDAAVEKLKAAGLLYPCYETQEELELKRKIRLTRRLPRLRP